MEFSVACGRGPRRGQPQCSARASGPDRHAAFVLHGRDTEATFTRNYIVCRDRTPGVFELWVHAAFVCLPSPTSLFSTPSVRSDICDGGNPKRAKLDGDSSTVGDDYPLLHIRIDGQRRLRVPGVRPRVHRSGDARIAQADPPILAGRLPLNPSSTFPSVTVQLTFPRIDAVGLIFSVELWRFDDAHSGDFAFLECHRIGPVLKVDLWYDDHLPEDEVYLQDEKHPIRTKAENAYVAKLRQYREKYGGHALMQTPKPTAHCPPQHCGAGGKEH